MSITTTTHLNFTDGRAREALEFYAAVFGGTAAVTTYGDVGMPADQPGADRVVFGHVATDDGFRVMAYDVPATGDAAAAPTRAGSTRREHGVTLTDQPFFVSVRGESLDEVTTYWDRLADGATVVEPLAASAWSPGFGMLTDRFGVTWSVDVQPAA
ncbi:VOC family protein [Patulibacter sp. SYSU D01012]|uniref:VOC family protein n=1 Tax=Patulibacter sp. SYSU D01012 TaxID=2817381 RepID=UPI001B30BC14|nr:VOC family protein [Patulibacter sp. SYSU D01012]